MQWHLAAASFVRSVVLCCVVLCADALIQFFSFVFIFCCITLHTGNFVVAFILVCIAKFLSPLFTFHFYVFRFGLHPSLFHIWLHFSLVCFFLYSVDVIIAIFIMNAEICVTCVRNKTDFFFSLCVVKQKRTKHAPTAIETYYMLHHFVAECRWKMGWRKHSWISLEQNTSPMCATVVNWKFHFPTSRIQCDATESDARCTGRDCHTIVTFFCTKNHIRSHIYSRLHHSKGWINNIKFLSDRHTWNVWNENLCNQCDCISWNRKENLKLWLDSPLPTRQHSFHGFIIKPLRQLAKKCLRQALHSKFLSLIQHILNTIKYPHKWEFYERLLYTDFRLYIDFLHFTEWK